MIPGRDSSFDRPTSAQLAAAYAAGVRAWGGYFGIRPRSELGLAVLWDQADFQRIKDAGMTAIGFCSGWDDPGAIRDRATAWGILPCVDVETGIRVDGLWIDGWLALSGAGLYGNGSVHFETGRPVGRGAAFNIVSGYFGYDPQQTWEPWLSPNIPLAPHGWQWQGGHPEFGIDVDSMWLDDWFGPAFSGGIFRKEDHPMAALVQDSRGGTYLVADACYGPKRPVMSSAELQAYQATLTALGLPSAPRTDIPQFVVDAMTSEKGYETFDPDAVAAALAALKAAVANISSGASGTLTAAQQAELDGIRDAEAVLSKHLGVGTP